MNDSPNSNTQVKTTQPRRYLVRPNQGVLSPGGSEQVQILLVERDKIALLQTYQRLGQTALDHSKDKFLVQSCIVDEAFVQTYRESGYEVLTTMWNNIAQANNAVANKKLHVKHVVTSASQASPATAAAPFSSTNEDSTAKKDISNLSNEQLTAEIHNLRRKYDELVAFSVNLTAERDILNNTLEQTKRDLNRARNSGSTNRNDNNKNKNSPSRSNTWTTWVLLLVAVLAFLLGVRMQTNGTVQFLHDIPILGQWLGVVPKGESPIREPFREEL